MAWLRLYRRCGWLINFLIRPDLGVTGGSFRALKIEVEPGSIFAAEEPAACLQYGTHTMLLVDLIIRALALALPEQVAAGLPGRRLECHHGSALAGWPHSGGLGRSDGWRLGG
ncbi:MAG: hydantoinase B/oxoprolinase family protein [Anaerolineales bacterium]|nr:hydantoinase B/oxoprolinase family protein [Anaerolineales bacterium]